MAKPGRNDRCPCGSGKKYKACCLTKDEAAAREQLATAQAQREEHAAEKRLSLREVRAAMLAKLAGSDVSDDDVLFEDDLLDDDLMAASNAVFDLIRSGKHDEAEAAARALLTQYPDVHDGWDRLGRVHEARGQNAEAADCYRKVVEFLDQNPDYSEPAFKDAFVARIIKLDPPTTS
jgi:uncharacterized protein YecA (UPF0149 family)